MCGIHKIVLILLTSLLGMALSQTCGRQQKNFGKFSNDIDGGCYAALGEFPWEGLLEVYNASTNTLKTYCGITLISNRFALTSAVCIDSADRAGNSAKIRFGFINVTDYTVPIYTIAHSWINSNYDSANNLHNLGIIQLNQSVTFNENVQPICLTNDDDSLLHDANTVAGWGYWSLDSQICGNNSSYYYYGYSSSLIKSFVPVIKNHLCQLYYPDFNVTLTNDTLCAGSDYTGAGNGGDWATPLMAKNQNGTYFQTGIFSAYFYTVENNTVTNDLLAQRLYTRVSSYCNWIANTTNNTAVCYEANAPVTKAPSTIPPPTQYPQPNYSCGLRAKTLASEKIFGGCYAQNGEFPWEGLLELYNNVNGVLLQRCGITLISLNYGLTSASCALILKTNVLHIVTLGAVKRTDPNSYKTVLDPALVFVHPEYNTSNYLHNVAVVKFAVPVPLSANIQPICISTDDSEILKQANTVAGWGYWSLDRLYGCNVTTPMISNRSEILIKTQVPVIKHHLCQLYYPNFNESLTQDTLCAGSDSAGAATNSDWATPLMAPNQNGVWYQTGVYSMYFYVPYFVPILAQRIYARTSSYCGWFANVSNGEVQCRDPGYDGSTQPPPPATTQPLNNSPGASSPTSGPNPSTTQGPNPPSGANKIGAFSILFIVNILWCLVDF